MLLIRKITDVTSPANRTAVAEVEAIMRAQFPGMPAEESTKLADQLRNPFKYGFVSKLFVAEDRRGRVRGLAVLMHDPDLGFAYLELISAAPGLTGQGMGAVLYERVRIEAEQLGAKGIYFECLPDDPALSPDAKVRRQNQARLRFYERYGAVPILGTAYEIPVEPGTTDSPYLVFDGLGRFGLPDAPTLARIVRAVLERKYGHTCPPEYIAKVVDSVRRGGAHLRSRRHVAAEAETPRPNPLPNGGFPIVVNDRHNIHHIRERGYVEAPVRIASILAELDKTGLFERIEPKRFSDRFLKETHDGGLVDYIERACAEAPERRSVYPYVFPLRNPQRRPKDRSVLAGYWCIDTFTPLNRNAYPAARRGVDCALTAAEQVLGGAPLAYALVRPPGHHAERRAYGGFCYFCNAAVAAQFLSRYGRVAILDIDYHHGNGQQDIFYERSDVLTVSVHGHPSFAYPYFSGFADERGRGAGAGYNVNLPLAETVTPEQHREAVRTGLRRIARFDPAFLVLAVGFDTANGDPTGSWSNRAADFLALGRMIGEAGHPIVAIQEGGYRVRTLGVNARNFFTGLAAGIADVRRPAQARPRAQRVIEPAALTWRDAVTVEDIEKVRLLVVATDMFTSPEVAIAAELVEERVARGRVSTYEFVLAEDGGALVGYACYGRTPGTDAAFDLYWIVVAPSAQGRGIGRSILARVEAAVAAAGGRHVYVDTSSTEKYAPTRAYYRRSGFRKLADLPDFYRAGDGKVILRKEVTHADDSAGADTRPGQ
jgi:acetoin utilization deacetylase AcuC-like enzyme/N-acetylglutamate synthase-like GNAT family acetyltransferase